jgi:ribonuclease HI
LIEVYFDGLCQPINPGGIPCYAFVVKRDGKTIYSEYGVAGEPFSQRVEIKSDSQLVVNQLSGDYKVKSRRIISLYKEVLLLKNKFQDIRIIWIPRDKNREADKLTNKAYNKALQEKPEYLDRI